MDTDRRYKFKMSLIENTAKRIPVCIVIDCSGSMRNCDGTGVSRIERVNQGLEQFYKDCREDKKAKNALEVLIIGVGNDANIISEFSSITEEPPKLKYLMEKGDLEKGLTLGLSMLDERKKVYDSYGISSYQPWLVVMSDGDATNKENTAKRNLIIVQKEIREREAKGKLSVFPVYVQGKPYYDELTNSYRPIKMETYQKRLYVMGRFSNNPSRVINLDLSENNSFKELFQFLHRSASSIASGKGFIVDEKFGNFREKNERKIVFSKDQLRDILQVDEAQEAQEESTDSNLETKEDKEENNSASDLSANEDNKEIHLEQDKILNDFYKTLSDYYDNVNEVHNTSHDKKDSNNEIKLFINDNEVNPARTTQEGKIILKIFLQREDNINIEKDGLKINIITANNPIRESGIYNIEILNNEAQIILFKTIEVHTFKKSLKTYEDYDEKLKNIDWNNI